MRQPFCDEIDEAAVEAVIGTKVIARDEIKPDDRLLGSDSPKSHRYACGFTGKRIEMKGSTSTPGIGLGMSEQTYNEMKAKKEFSTLRGWTRECDRRFGNLEKFGSVSFEALCSRRGSDPTVAAPQTSLVIMAGLFGDTFASCDVVAKVPRVEQVAAAAEQFCRNTVASLPAY